MNGNFAPVFLQRRPKEGGLPIVGPRPAHQGGGRAGELALSLSAGS